MNKLLHSGRGMTMVSNHALRSCAATKTLTSHQLHHHDRHPGRVLRYYSVSNVDVDGNSSQGNSAQVELRPEGFASGGKASQPILWRPSNEILDYAHCLVHEGDLHAKDCELFEAINFYKVSYNSVGISIASILLVSPTDNILNFVYQQAIVFLKQHLQCEDSDIACIYNKLGVALFKEDQLDDALSAFRDSMNILNSSLELTANKGVVLKNIAEVYRRKDNVDEALEFYRDAISYFRDSPDEASSTFEDVYSSACLVYTDHGKEDLQDASDAEIDTAKTEDADPGNTADTLHR